MFENPQNLDLKAENYRPNESQDHPRVPVNDVLSTNVLQPDFSVEESQALVDILHSVDSHLAAVRLPELLARYYLQQLQQLSPIS